MDKDTWPLEQPAFTTLLWERVQDGIWLRAYRGVVTETTRGPDAVIIQGYDRLQGKKAQGVLNLNHKEPEGEWYKRAEAEAISFMLYGFKKAQASQ